MSKVITPQEAERLKAAKIYEAFVNYVTTIPSSASEITLSDGTHAHVPDV